MYSLGQNRELECAAKELSYIAARINIYESPLGILSSKSMALIS